MRCSGTNTSSATTVQLPVAAIPLACQSSSAVRSRQGTRTQVGIAPSPSSSGRSALTTLHLAPKLPVLNGHEPFRVTPPLVGVAVPVGESPPLIRGSPSPRISSCASSGRVAASHAMALKIVATHELDGHPTAMVASTSHCVSKSAS